MELKYYHWRSILIQSKRYLFLFIYLYVYVYLSISIYIYLCLSIYISCYLCHLYLPIAVIYLNILTILYDLFSLQAEDLKFYVNYITNYDEACFVSKKWRTENKQVNTFIWVSNLHPYPSIYLQPIANTHSPYHIYIYRTAKDGLNARNEIC